MCTWILKQLQSTCLFTSYSHFFTGGLICWVGRTVNLQLHWAQLSKISKMTFLFIFIVFFITSVWNLLSRDGQYQFLAYWFLKCLLNMANWFYINIQNFVIIFSNSQNEYPFFHSAHCNVISIGFSLFKNKSN